MASPKERLQKYLARCGHGSRRRAELLIEQGLVMVNGKAATLGDSIVPGRDVVILHGEKVAPPRSLTVMFHKTAGTISSTHDTHDRLTVMDMLPKRIVDAIALNQREIIVAEGMEEAMGELRRTPDQLLDQVAAMVAKGYMEKMQGE